MLEQIEDDVRPHRGVGRNKIGSGTVKRTDVALRVGPTDDLGFRAKFAAVNGEIDIGVVLAGGDDDRGGFADFGLLEHLEPGGTAQHVVLVVANAARQFLDNLVIESALGQGTRGGSPHAAAADDDHMGFLDMVDTEHPVVVLNHFLGTREHQNRTFADLGFRAGTFVLTTIPDSDHTGIGHFPEVALGQRLADERRTHDHGLGDKQLVEMPDHMCHGIITYGAAREELPHHFAQANDVFAPSKFQDINGRLGLGQRYHPNLFIHQLAYSKGDVGVGLVLAGGHDHRRLLDADIPIGLRIV